MLRHPLIHALVAPAKQDYSFHLRQLMRDCLVKHAALWRQNDDCLFRLAAHALIATGNSQRCNAVCDGFGLEYHALAAAERTVIDGAMAVMRERPQVVDPYVNEPSFARLAHNAVIQRSTKEVRKNRYDLKLHSRVPFKPYRRRFFPLPPSAASACCCSRSFLP